MHGSSAGFRSRQRTFTSCTECRRRKQKCNQAKDRPCSNCARRYPPPLCTYESSSPTTPPIGQAVNFGNSDRQRARLSQPNNLNETPNPVVLYTSQYYSGPNQNSHNASPTYHSPSPTTRNDGRLYQGSSSSNQQVIGSSSGGGDLFPMSGEYYASDQMGYNTTESPHGIGYYTASDQPQWLTGGDPDVFVGTGTAEYFYVDESELPRSSGGGRQ
ncbi:uncharacterized protein BP5553_04929 [Venustampulla echinocandica]|uniref:Zn(2)-C6 fungal-type domain-containing protein n=1 Tax=Venustampulla echinocandica TaxID=2656787 RepID=A0A370TPP2_9HELO|nr:uncharacterized protein BP5553_04929 [Venustampulla echinocandica]RDL37496.1 hypothetical protein BP5553_04929 [Venustampulla echinocandica]